MSKKEFLEMVKKAAKLPDMPIEEVGKIIKNMSKRGKSE